MNVRRRTSSAGLKLIKSYARTQGNAAGAWTT